MFENYLQDTCDIYHLADTQVNAGYGITVTMEQHWSDSADEEDVPCHFHVSNGSLQNNQQDPHTILEGTVKLSLPAGTDIRKNDLVISKTSASIEAGVRFRASVPRTIYNGHHITVMLEREDGLKGAI